MALRIVQILQPFKALSIEAIVNNNSGNWTATDCGTDIVFSSSGFSGLGVGELGKEVKEIMRLSRENLNNNLIFGEGIRSTISSGTVLNTQAGRGLFINAGHVTDGGDNDLDGGTLTLSGGAGKGTGAGGDIVFNLCSWEPQKFNKRIFCNCIENIR